MTKRFVLPGLALAAALTLAGCSAGTTDDEHAGGDPTGAASSSAAPDRAERADDGRFNAADRSFARGMIPHHEQAVVMSDVVLAADGVDPQVRELAQAIKAAQQPEIDQLATWLDEWGPDPAEPDGEHGDHEGMSKDMNGMMSEEDLADLEAADGAAAGSLFLTQMIEHHLGAVDMARTELDEGRHAGALAMAGEIVEVQQAEIDRMRELLERQ